MPRADRVGDAVRPHLARVVDGDGDPGADPRLDHHRVDAEVAGRHKHNIAYANWNFKAGSFGIVDQNLKPRKQLVSILTAK